MMKVKLEDMTWPEVEEVLQKPNAMILPVGSIEQHGLHLPLNIDFRCAEYMAWKAAKKVTDEYNIRVLVAPALRYTEGAFFSKYPGNTGISFDTLVRVIGDIIYSFASQGFKNIIVINGHFPNRDAIAAAFQKTGITFREAGMTDVGLYAANWWDLGSKVVTNIRKSELGLHAEEIETSVSLVIQPENVELDKALKWFPSFSLSDKWVGGPPNLIQQFPAKVFSHPLKGFPRGPGDPAESQGVMGDPTVATKETGEKIIVAVVDDLAQLIVEVAQSGQA